MGVDRLADLKLEQLCHLKTVKVVVWL